MTDAGMTLQRAQDKISQMQARGAAIDELIDTGALPDALGGGKDDIQAQLDATSQAGQVDSELAALKAELGSAEPAAGLPSGSAGAAPATPSARPPIRRRRRKVASCMIVRILGEGRYDVPDADMPAIEQLDAQLTEAMDGDDEAAFDATLADLIGQIRHVGALLAPDDLQTSGLVVPHEGSSLAEVKTLLSEEA